VPYLFDRFGVLSAVVNVTFAIVRFNNASKLHSSNNIHEIFVGPLNKLKVVCTFTAQKGQWNIRTLRPRTL